MDSGSSGSIQSSSGGDEEYDSRAQGISGFLNNPPTPRQHVGPMANASPCPVQPQNPHSIFDPFSNFFHPNLPTPSNQQQNSLLDLHNAWPRNPIQIPASSSFVQVPEVPRPLATLTSDPSDVVHTTPAPNPGPVRNPRKRSRASRRAPTTVLTTDTSNFRAMVQEFTGIPAPPFTPASSNSNFPRARLDLFGGTSTSSPPYLLRPFPQKLSPFAHPTPTTTSILSSSSQFLLPKHNHLPLPTMNPIFNLQQPTTTHNSNINLLGSHLQVSVDSSAPHATENRNPPHHLPEDFLSGNGNILPTSWGSTAGGGGGGPPSSDQALFRTINAKYCSGTTKLNNNYSASSSSDFHGDHKGSDINNNVTTRTEGIIESWICSSD